MIRSLSDSCTYCDIINLIITTITLCIAQKMQEAERILNHHVYNFGAIRCIHRDSKSSCFCTYCDIINLSITTITLCIAQKMQEAERILNHHVYNVGAIRCIHDDSKSTCFLYLL